MSILSKFFSRKAAKSNEAEAIVINQVKSFKLEFPDNNPKLLHNGRDLMQCNTSCHVIVNGISMNIDADFSIETPMGDGFTLEDVVFIDRFLPTRSALPDGTPTPVAFSHLAIVQLMTYIKTHLKYERYELDQAEEEEGIYLCI